MYAAFLERGDQMERIGQRAKRLVTAQGRALMYAGAGQVAIWRVDDDGKPLARIQLRRHGKLQSTEAQ